MVVVYGSEFPEDKIIEAQKDYSFELDHFQKYAIETINEDKHVLVTAHTGSGKTLPAEYAIQKYCRNGKKVIYTAPIKSLSNQKFNEFTEKYPDISFGILTGDIKFNPEADCLIMTTEILRNTLFQKTMMKNSPKVGESERSSEEQSRSLESLLNFNMDFENELKCVIFDEVHYINDADRGKVWEESIMMLPKHVNMVMLSATIDRSEEFGAWVEKTTGRDVCICSTQKRVIPLSHYVYLNYPKSFYKGMANEEATQIQSQIENPVLLKEHNGYVREENYEKMKRIQRKALQNGIYTKASFVLKNVVSYLQEKELLPAICFVFSRKNVEKYAKQLNMNLIENGNEVEQECERIIKKLPNHREYMETPEYKTMISLLRKGIAIHHSGIIPILKEMVEMLFSKGFIKILFATETFAVGVNMPAKTVLFTGINKYNGGSFRYLHSHEYTQMAGRAGRRGLDKIGVVIHMLNMFQEMPLNSDYKKVLDGKPQHVVSKFKIHNNLVLRIVSNQSSVENFVSSSMITKEIESEYKQTEDYILGLEEKNKNLELTIKNKEYVEDYHTKQKKLVFLKNKHRKRMAQDIVAMENETPKLKDEYAKYVSIIENKYEIEEARKTLDYIQNYVKNTTLVILKHLESNGFVEKQLTSQKEEEIVENQLQYKVTPMGLVASQIQEVHSMTMSNIVFDRRMNQLSSSELASYLSIFTQIKVGDDHKSYDKNGLNDYMKSLIQYTEERYDKYYDFIIKNRLDNVEDFELQYDLVQSVYDWCEATNETECQQVLAELKTRGVFVGEFIKAILKINNVAGEIEKVCNLTNNIELMKNVNDIPRLTMKSIVSGQSLYL